MIFPFYLAQLDGNQVVGEESAVHASGPESAFLTME
jgi:hypothetical protein